MIWSIRSCRDGAEVRVRPVTDARCRGNAGRVDTFQVTVGWFAIETTSETMFNALGTTIR